MKEKRAFISGNRFLKPLIGFIRTGTNPRKMAHAVGWGFALGTIPLPGTSTIMCTLVAMPLKLNLALIQAVNYAVFPLQLLLLLPFYYIGAVLSGTPVLHNFPDQITDGFQNDWWGTFSEMLELLFYATLSWMVVIAPLSILLARLSKPVIERMMKKEMVAGEE